MLLNMNALWEGCDLLMVMVNSVLLLGRPVINAMESMFLVYFSSSFLELGIWAYSILANALANSSAGLVVWDFCFMAFFSLCFTLS